MFDNLEGVQIVQWCMICQAERATEEVEAQFHGEWMPLTIGQSCLTRMQTEGRMEM